MGVSSFNRFRKEGQQKMIYQYKDKITNVRLANQYTLAKTLSMFDYTGLPETIPEKELERILQENGCAFVYQWGDDIIAFSGSLSGDIDYYNNPTEITITNNKTRKNKTVPLNEGVLILNDDYKLGILPLINKYNTLINENEISIVMANFNNRVQKILSASDDNTKASANQFINKIINGELAIIGESPFLQDLKVQGSSVSNAQSFSDMIELNQYFKASLLNELGIQANTNNKKERLINAEVEQNKELLYPLVNNMYNNRVEAVQAINDKFGLNVSVEYGSVWKDRNVEKGLENGNTIEVLENQDGSVESDSEITDSESE